MDNAIIVDGVLVVLLITGTAIGASRGLFRSLMGLVVLVAALVGSVLLADFLTPAFTSAIAPKVENALVEQFSAAVEQGVGTLDSTDGDTGGDTDAYGLYEKLQSLGLSNDVVLSLVKPLDGARDWTTGAKDKAVDTFREAVSPVVWSLVRSVVHAALLLVLYILLTIVLRLALRVLDHVFDLPVLSTLNGVGGAVLGFLEAAVLISVAVYVASRLGVKLITEHTQDTLLLPLFLKQSPIALISSLSTEIWYRDKIS